MEIGTTTYTLGNITLPNITDTKAFIDAITKLPSFTTKTEPAPVKSGTPESCKITLSMTIDGIYGKCEYRYHSTISDENEDGWSSIKQFVAPTPNKHCDKLKYSYVCNATRDSDCKKLTSWDDSKKLGLPMGITPDEYYQMCKLQQAEKVFKANMKLAGATVWNDGTISTPQK